MDLSHERFLASSGAKCDRPGAAATFPLYFFCLNPHEVYTHTMCLLKKPIHFLLCIRNDECEDLELRKLYRRLPDKRAEHEGFVRVVDESGEDYLYPESYFAAIRLARKTQEAVAVCG